MLSSRPTRRGGMAAVVGLLVVGAVGALIFRESRSPSTESPGTGSALSTVKVVRRDLVETEKFNGTLGFENSRELAASRAGTITTITSAGRTVDFGKPLLSINREPAILLEGSFPAYRALTSASRNGPDIKQLEQSLVSLGYGTDLAVDEDFTSATAAAVREWEEDLGRATPNGSVDLGDLLFAPTPLRVSQVLADNGRLVQAGSSVLKVSSTNRIVSVNLSPTRASALKRGDQVLLKPALHSPFAWKNPPSLKIWKAVRWT
jgi:Putative peptidoglycan binding domain